MTWRNCKASITLIEEVNKRWPKRDTASDGTIGDAAHASRNSDHNPWIIGSDGVGVVTARDIDEDLDGVTVDSGPDAKELFNHLLSLGKSGDKRLKYLIYEGYIYSAKHGWVTRTYTGLNSHSKHIHVSFSTDPQFYDSTAPWGIHPTQSTSKELTVSDINAILKSLDAIKVEIVKQNAKLDTILRETSMSIEPSTGVKATGRYLIAQSNNRLERLLKLLEKG